MEAKYVTAVLWQNAEGGSERCVLERLEDGYRLRGTACLLKEREPVEARYAVVVDSEWRTQEAHVQIEFPGGDVREPFVAGGLWSGREPPPAHRDCVDVDLGFSPSTNTLPIRRLRLEVAESAEIVVAWLRWPELTVEPSEQRYERLSEAVYRFSSGEFTAELHVEEHGLVLDYEGLWRALGRG